jgi:hypothetical protein
MVVVVVVVVVVCVCGRGGKASDKGWREPGGTSRVRTCCHCKRSLHVGQHPGRRPRTAYGTHTEMRGITLSEMRPHDTTTVHTHEPAGAGGTAPHTVGGDERTP